MYPHIPREEGLETKNKREDKSVSSDSLYKLTKIILKRNYFKLGQDVYHQILGYPIVTKNAPHYANIFMAGLEEEIFSSTEFQPLLWLRYLDDIFCLWTDTIEKLKEFLEFLNAFHSSIKFTMDYSPYQFNYLDVLITKDESGKTLCTSLCRKPTDTHQHIHAQSCHRAVYKKPIPYTQAVRMKRICSEEKDLQHKLRDMESSSVNRGCKAESVRR